jgi:hypothetical protein
MGSYDALRISFFSGRFRDVENNASSIERRRTMEDASEGSPKARKPDVGPSCFMFLLP